MRSYIRKYTQEDTFNNQPLSLLILGQMGLPTGEAGIKLYAEVLENTAYFLGTAQNENEVEELKEQLLNPYSQFYFDIAQNDNDMGLKTFHTLIKKSLPLPNPSAETATINKDNYKKVAFILGQAISLSTSAKLNEQSKTRKLAK